MASSASLLSTPLWRSNQFKLNTRITQTFKFSSPYLPIPRFSLQSALLLDPAEESLAMGIMDLPWIRWISPEFLPTKPNLSCVKFREDYESLRARQIKAETEAWENATEEYKELERIMIERKLAPCLPYVKSLCLGWFEPFRDAISTEQKLQESKKKRRNAHAPYISVLPADKMAVIVMSKIMELLMPRKEEGCSVSVTQAAVRVGEAIEQEFKIQMYLQKTKELETAIQQKHINCMLKMRKIGTVQKLIKKEIETEPWSRVAQAQLGSCLIKLLIDSAYVQEIVDRDGPPVVRPAFIHVRRKPGIEKGKLRYGQGMIECDPLVYKGLDSSSARHMMIPYLPMLVPPRNWKGYDEGGYFFLPSKIMRIHGAKDQQITLKNTPQKQLKKVFEALDVLGSTKWRVNRRVLDVIEQLWNDGGAIAGLVDCHDIPLVERPDTDDPSEIQKWRWSNRKARKTNNEMHSLRCDTELILSVARKMRYEEGFHYPHNLDFRGRAYPMHSHLTHLGSDLCRGLLQFSQGRVLGGPGLRWLKIHLANLYGRGVEKLSYDKRLDFVEDNLREIFDSAYNPIGGNRWWVQAEDPFQFLGACFELSDALKSVRPCNMISHLPVHQDGSCNGLQHYAALGRFAPEAAAVNLVAGEKPADVYSGVASRVMDRIKEDSLKDPAIYPKASLAKILVSQIDRKLVKQTVMTSVYGVTFVGAREQIKRRLQEKGLITDDRLLFSASSYAAKVTLDALGEMFEAARGIMSWLSDCAKVITAENQPVRWTTPLGLPVVQPYRISNRKTVKTYLQVLSLHQDGHKISAREQRTAFPPNFVHSLDSTHMMMTAIACKNAGLTFAGVHDSFWTHACDVDKMNRILREKFVDLYNMPILENLLESFEMSFPTLEFPPLPKKGDFDLRNVLDSPYFFN